MTADFDAIATFFSSHDAVRAERLLLASGLTVKLVPGPKEISPNCGVALALHSRDAPSAERLIAKAGVPYEAFHPYHVRPKESWLGRLLSRTGAESDGRKPQ